MISASRKWIYAFVCLSFLLSLIGVQPVYAAGIVVNTNADNLNDDGLCTLREAITTANSDLDINTGDCTTGSGPDTITFAGNYTITLSYSSGGQLPAITSTVTITGIGQGNTIIQAGSTASSVAYRVLEVSNSGNLTLNNLTVRHGNCIPGSCATDLSSGGGILNGNILTLSNVLVSLNSAAYGGGVHNKSGATLTATNSTFSSNTVSVFGPEDGAAIMNDGGTVNIISSTISANVSNGGNILSNGTSGTMNITNSTVTGNTFGSGGGYVVYSSGTALNIKNNTIANNTLATGGYAGVMNLLGTLNISNSIVYGNTSGSDGYDCVVMSIPGSTLGTNTNNIIGVNGTTEFNTCGTASNSDPLLGTLANNGGPTQTLALLSGSPAINAGDNATCAGDPVNNLDQRGVARPQGEHCDIGAYEAPLIITFNSIAAQDGWVLESTETSNKGGKINSGGSTINIGDDATNRQYRAILSFNTALPEGAVITKATLKFRYAGKAGTLPFSTHGKLLVDVKKGAFSNNSALQLDDFNAGANKSTLFSLGKSTNWFTKVFSAGQLTYINTSGVTQFRLRFAKDDNNDLGTDLLKLHSGSAGSDAPQLIIEYTVP